MPEILAEVDESIDITATVAATPGSLTDDYNDMQNRPSINGVELEGDKTTLDLHIDVVPLAQNLVANDGTTNTSPYTLRTPPSYAGSVAELKKIVGGTIGWNQLVLNADFADGTNAWSLNATASSGLSATTANGALTYTVTDNTKTTRPNIAQIPTDNPSISVTLNHVYLLSAGIKLTTSYTGNYPFGFLYANQNKSGLVNPTRGVWTQVQTVIKPDAAGTYNYNLYWTNNITYLSNGDKVEFKAPQVFDLTAMFGSTIADAIATMETTTAGSGVAFFRSLFPADYYAYSVPTLASVNTSARKVLDSNGNTVRTYPLDSSLTLRGVPKLVDGALQYDGDEYLPNGQVTRKYAEVDLGTLTWGKSSSGTGRFYVSTNTSTLPYATGTIEMLCSTYIFDGAGSSSSYYGANGTFRYYPTIAGQTIREIYFVDEAKASMTAAQFKSAMSGVKLVYPVLTPTTETADPYTEVQLVDNQGSEQFVTTNNVPVGNETMYPMDLTGVVQDLAPLPTTAGTYKLQVTVSGGVPSYAWVAG